MGLRASLKPTRQVECVELMVSANNITVAYAQALVAATLSNLLVGETKPKKMTGVSADQMAKMGREMGNLQEQVQAGRADLRTRYSQTGAGQGLSRQADGQRSHSASPDKESLRRAERVRQHRSHGDAGQMVARNQE